MAIRQIVTDSDEILRKKSKDVDKIDERIIKLLDDMNETLVKADGAGLAAVQVGVLRRVIVIHVGKEKLEIINPRIISAEGNQESIEGCLSCPGKFRLLGDRSDRYGSEEFDYCEEDCAEADRTISDICAGYIEELEDYYIVQRSSEG